MLVLKIDDKGLFLEIPGTKPTRTPAEIDITKCDLSSVNTYLRKHGIRRFNILSREEKPKVKVPTQNDIPLNNINSRFTRLEKMVEALLEKQANNSPEKEQITEKLDRLEKLTRKLLSSDKTVTEKVKSSKVKKSDPKVEELDTFIPEINVSDMKIKGSVKSGIKQDKIDLDDSADLLSRIMSREE